MGEKYSYDFEIAPFARAWEHGSYGNAYESEDFGSWRYEPDQMNLVAKSLGFKHVPGSVSQAIEAGLALGFFASYEDHEIPGQWREWVCSLRALNKELAKEAGIGG